MASRKRESSAVPARLKRTWVWDCGTSILLQGIPKMMRFMECRIARIDIG
jgi:hypothetical protein